VRPEIILNSRNGIGLTRKSHDLGNTRKAVYCLIERMNDGVVEKLPFRVGYEVKGSGGALPNIWEMPILVMRGIHVFRDEHHLGDLVLRVVAALLRGTIVWVYTVDDLREPGVRTSRFREVVEAIGDILADLWIARAVVKGIETVLNKLTKSTAKRPMEVVRPGGDEQQVNSGNTLSDYPKLVNSILDYIIVGIARADLRA
jgi:hypothetical protein